MIHAVNSRLAAHAQIWGVEAVVKADQSAAIIDREIAAVWRDLLATLGRPLATALVLDNLLHRLSQVLSDRLHRVAGWARASTVETLLDTLPVEWLYTPVPIREDVEHGFVGLSAGVNITTPITALKEPSITKEQYREKLGKMLFPAPLDAEVNAIVYGTTAGLPWRERLASSTKIAGATPEKISQIVAAGYAAGKQPRDIAKDLRPILQNVQSSARRIARTECLPAESFVNGANVIGVCRRLYRGQMVKIVTEKGREFTGTPNHPMLTRQGWIALANLAKGDNLVCDRANIKKLGSSRNEYVHAAPTTIGEIFDSLSAIGIGSRKRTGKPDFHGDGVDGYVDILTSNRVLRHGRLASGNQLSKQFGFSESYISTGQLSAFCDFPIILLSKSAHFVSVSYLDAESQKCIGKPKLVYSEIGSQFGQGDSTSVLSGGGFNGEIPPVMRSMAGRPTRSQRCAKNSGKFEDSFYRACGNSNDVADGGNAQTGLIEIDRVKSLVVIENWSGHVFNLETEDGYYISNGLYTKNCARIAGEMKMKTDEALGDLVIGFQVHARLDQNTRPWHAERNGRIFYKEPKLGQPGLYDMPHPPIEAENPAARPPGAPKVSFNCRCHLGVVLRQKESIQANPVFTTAAAKLVPDPAIYADWFDRADERRRRLAVGTRRYTAAVEKHGEVKWAHFLDPKTGDLLKVDRLKREAAHVTAARIAQVDAIAAENAAKIRGVATFGFEPIPVVVPLMPMESAKIDELIYAVWRSRKFRTYKALGRALGKTVQQISQAVKRYKKLIRHNSP